jgi:large conductance mechanosensitive channel
MISEFRAFILKQNILALAIAVVVGAALNLVIKSVVDDFIMPIVGAAVPGGEWRTAVWRVGPVAFGVGNFLSALVNFVIVAFIAWRLTRLFVKEEAATPVTRCQFCRMETDPAAVRCPHCTSQLAGAKA